MKNPGNRAGVFANNAIEISEVVVHAESQITCLQSVVAAGYRVGAAAKIHVEVLDFRRPIRREADLHAGTAGPADDCLVFFHAEELSLELAISEAESPVQKNIVDRKTGPSAQSAEPGVGEFVRRECVVSAAGLNVGLDTEYELPRLPIVAKLAAAGDAARLKIGIGDFPPFVAEVEACIWAGPVIDTRWWRVIRRGTPREICRAGR